MDFDDFFDDFDWKDGVLIGSFFDYMTEDEFDEERRRKKMKRRRPSNPDDLDWQDLDDEDYPDEDDY